MANPVTDILTALAACLQAKVTEHDLPPLCEIAPVPGDAAGSDYFGNCRGKNGLGWTRLIQAYPAATIGEPSNTPGNCGHGLGLEIEMGITRNIREVKPTEHYKHDELIALVTQQQDEMMVMLEAVHCCNAIDAENITLGAWTPIGPLGTEMGGTWTMATIL